MSQQPKYLRTFFRGSREPITCHHTDESGRFHFNLLRKAPLVDLPRPQARHFFLQPEQPRVRQDWFWGERACRGRTARSEITIISLPRTRPRFSVTPPPNCYRYGSSPALVLFSSQKTRGITVQSGRRRPKQAHPSSIDGAYGSYPAGSARPDNSFNRHDKISLCPLSLSLSNSNLRAASTISP